MKGQSAVSSLVCPAQVTVIITCVAGAVPLMWYGKSGWGWLIFLAVLLGAG